MGEKRLFITFLCVLLLLDYGYCNTNDTTIETTNTTCLIYDSRRGIFNISSEEYCGSEDYYDSYFKVQKINFEKIFVDLYVEIQHNIERHQLELQQNKKIIEKLEEINKQHDIEKEQIIDIMLRQEDSIKYLQKNYTPKKYIKFIGVQIENLKDQIEILTSRKFDMNLFYFPETELKQERFVLIKRDSKNFPYYTIHVKDGYINDKLSAQKFYYSDLEILLDFKCGSHCKHWYNRIKSKLTEKQVIFKGYNINLSESNVTEIELVKEMKKIGGDKSYDEI